MNILAIIDWPFLKNIHDLQNFMAWGTISRNLSHIFYVMHDFNALNQGQVHFSWWDIVQHEALK